MVQSVLQHPGIRFGIRRFENIPDDTTGITRVASCTLIFDKKQGLLWAVNAQATTTKRR